MMNNVLTALLISILLSVTSGCSRGNGCEEYATMVRNAQDQDRIVRWADEVIFSRTFRREDFESVPRFVGPGKGGANFDLIQAEIQLPPLLDGYTVRSVGPHLLRPDVIFLGKRRYQGILVTRGPLDESLRRTTVDRQRVQESTDRVAMLCYADV